MQNPADRFPFYAQFVRGAVEQDYVSTQRLCIDDSNRPDDIQEKNWIKKGQVYTIVRMLRAANGQVSMQFREVQPEPHPIFPESGYNSRRFVPFYSTLN